LEGEAPDVPPVIADLVHQMLAKPPSERSSMREVFDTLDQFLSDPDQLRSRPRRELPPSTSQRPPLLGRGKGADPFAATVDGTEPLDRQVTPVSKNAATPRSLARGTSDPAGGPSQPRAPSGEEGREPGVLVPPRGSEPGRTPQVPEAAVQTAQTANRQPLMLGALLVLMIVVAVLFIQLRAANKSTPAVAPSIPPPSVAGEKPAAPAPSPPPPASPASAAVEAPPADKVPADKVPADKMPADKMPADKMPADKMPADKMIDHVQDNKSDAAKARAKTPKPRGVGKKAEVRSDRDAAAPKASKPSKPEDPEQPWR
jgi:hypothetical protein